MFRLLALSLVLIAPLTGRAVPVEISLSGFGVSSNGGPYGAMGISTFSLAGTLQADLSADMTLTNIYGAVGFQVLGTGTGGALLVTGGTIDLDGDGDSGSIASFFNLAGGSTLYFPDQTIFGPANSFDGSNLYLVGSTWNQYPVAPNSDRWLGVALFGKVRPVTLSGATTAVPEPTSFVLLAAGGLLVGAAVRKRV